MDWKKRFQQMKTEFRYYIETLTGLKNQKAIKTVQVCEALIMTYITN